MTLYLRLILAVALLPAFVNLSGQGRAASDDLASRIDALITAAYGAASTGFPCQVKARGNPKVLRWEDVDRCLSGAVNRVDWNTLSKQLEDLRAGENRRAGDEFWSAVDASLSARALVYENVISAKASDNVHLPLTNSLLKHLPADSLQNLPVYDRTGTQVGTFLGIYSFERTGGLASANTYRLSLFQYADRNGNAQGVGEKLLLDSYRVPWKDAKSQRGFRLSMDQLKPER